VKILLKVLVVGVVSCMTWLMTSSIIARQAIRTSPIQSVKSLQVTDVIAPGKLPPPLPVKLGVSGAFAEAYLRSSKVSVEGGMATVDAHVSMADRRQGMAYIWRLRAVDNLERPLNGHVYDQQIFSMEVNGQKEVTFHDILEVPQGTYRVELVLHEFRQGTGLAFLDDDKMARAAEMIRVVHLPKK